MSEIVLTDAQYEVSRARTYGEIIGLLEAHGITDYQYLKFEGREVLSFPITVKRADITQKFIVKMSVPRLMYAKRSVGGGKYARKTMTYLEKESWRVFWWYLKSKLNAVEYGISDDLREFMPTITYKITDATGREKETSIGEEVLENLNQLPKLLPAKDRAALEYRVTQE
jgi:hypothetical protein